MRECSDDTDYAAMFEASPTPTALLSPDATVERVNLAFLRATQRSGDQVIGRNLFASFPDNPARPGTDGLSTFRASLARVVETGQTDRLGILRHDVQDADGVFQIRYWNPVVSAVCSSTDEKRLLLQAEDVTLAVAGARLDDGELTAIAGSPASGGAFAQLATATRALADRNRLLQERCERLAASALHDPLTGALSRPVFRQELSRALSRLERRTQPLAVLFVDLDRLKQVNDHHGHAAGDALIRQTVQRLRACLRPSDVIARVGGDEFVVLLEDLSESREADAVAERMLAKLSTPFRVAPRVSIRPSASIGVAVAVEPSIGADTLISHADAAMYKAKQLGRGRFELFDAAEYTAAAETRQLEAELEAAVRGGGLALHYQTIFDLDKSRPTAVEALLRWHHPTRGLLDAGAFIDIAEASGLLTQIGPWVVAEACRQLARWDEELGDGSPESVFVNLSVTELVVSGIQERVEAALTSSRLEPSRLTIEVTESGMLDQDGRVSEVVRGLQELGCRVAIDDFGTGYSSLSRLVALPADILKIDRSFVQALAAGYESSAVIGAILLLAHNLRKTVVAEGVEDPNTLASLTELGCEFAQGYFLGRPRQADLIGADFRQRTLV